MLNYIILLPVLNYSIRKKELKVINRTEFLKEPKGTFYCKGKEWYFDNLYIKGDTIEPEDTFPGDWYHFDFCSPNSNSIFQHYEAALEFKISYEPQEIESRDGLFDLDDLFIVFEKEDLLQLKVYIDTALKTAKEGNYS